MLKADLLVLALWLLFPAGAEEFPDINELFAVTSLPGVARRRADADAPKDSILALDLEKLDINRFKKKLNELEARLTPQTRAEPNKTFESRKQFIKYLPEPKDGFVDVTYDKAHKYQIKLRFMDLMLQLVYQARHKMKFLSMNSAFKVDKPFKMSYLHAKIRNMVHKLRRIYTTQYIKGIIAVAIERWQYPSIVPEKVDWYFRHSKWSKALTMLSFHEKMVREHTNVVFLYRKIMSVHIEEVERETEENTIPGRYRTYTETLEP